MGMGRCVMDAASHPRAVPLTSNTVGTCPKTASGTNSVASILPQSVEAMFFLIEVSSSQLLWSPTFSEKQRTQPSPFDMSESACIRDPPLRQFSGLLRRTA